MHGYADAMDDMTLAGLRVVREVATLGSFTAAARSLGYSQPAISRQVAAMEGAAGVPLFVRNARGADWYNDSIATSPTRVLAGLRSFDKKIILIAGGYDKNLPFDPMVDELPARVRLLVLTGPTADKIEAGVRAHPDFAASGLQVLRAENMAAAVQAATGRPVHDIYSMISWFHAGLRPRVF